MPKSPPEPIKYFLTVSWCNKRPRGIFCTRTGASYSHEGRPHTDDEMAEILGPFWMVLAPKSLPFTESDFNPLADWYPLEEYNNVYGYAVVTKGE